MHAARLFVLPSIGDNEAFGIVQLEAMACGKAIVNTRLATGVPWVARDGAEARTVSPGSTAELAAAIRQLLDDGDGAAELGRRGRARVAELFERACFLAKTLAAYEAAALRRRSHSGGLLAVDKTALDQRIGP